MKLLQTISAHRYEGWQGQYNRMVRWCNRFSEIELKESQSETKSHQYFDTLFACFQNIFFLKDWVIQDGNLKNQEVNNFINSNKEVGLCRDICNGTKHFNISQPSVDAEFSIIREYDPFHKVWNKAPYEIIILAGEQKYKPYELILKCVGLWDEFLKVNLGLIKQ